MPTPRSLLHLNGADGSTVVTNSVTGGSAVPWAFAGAAGGTLTTASPYLGSAMAALSRYQYLASAAISPVGDWSLGFRIGQTNNSDNGQLAVITQGKSGDPGAWALLMGGDNDLYFFRQGSPDVGIDSSLDSGQATAINNKIKAGNAFMCVQYINGVLSIGLAGASETSVVKILSGTFTGGSAPAGIIRFNGRFGADGNAYADSGTSRIDEVIFQDGGAIWPTYPFTKPAGEYAFASDVTVNGAVVDSNDVVSGASQVRIGVTAVVRDRSDVVASTAKASLAAAVAVRDMPDVVQAAAQSAVAVLAGAVDAPDVLQAAAVASVAATGTVFDRADAVDASAMVVVNATGVVVDQADVAQAAGSVQAGVVAVTADLSDVASGAVAVSIVVAAAVVDVADVMTGTTALSAGVAAAVIDASDLVQAFAVVGVQVAAAVQDTADRITADARAAVSASGVIADGPDTMAGQAVAGPVPIVAIGMAVDASDTLAAAARSMVAVTGSVFDIPDRVQGQAVTVQPAIEASATVFDASDFIAGRAATSIAAMFACTDASDIVIGRAEAVVGVSAIVRDDSDVATGRANSTQLPVIEVRGAVYDAPDWLTAFTPGAQDRYGIQSPRRRQPEPARRLVTVFPERTATPMRARPRNLQGE